MAMYNYPASERAKGAGPQPPRSPQPAWAENLFGSVQEMGGGKFSYVNPLGGGSPAFGEDDSSLPSIEEAEKILGRRFQAAPGAAAMPVSAQFRKQAVATQTGRMPQDVQKSTLGTGPMPGSAAGAGIGSAARGWLDEAGASARTRLLAVIRSGVYPPTMQRGPEAFY